MANFNKWSGKIAWEYVIWISGLFLLILTSFHELLSSTVIINAMDVLTQDYFWFAFFKEKLQTDPSFITWNPYLNGGASFNGGLHLLFTPVTLICTILFPPNLTLTISGLIHLLIAGVFTLLYARLIGLGTMAAFLSAIFFMLSSELVSLINAGHIGKLNTIVYLPVVLYFLERAFRKRKLADFVLVSIVLSLQLYEGHIQIAFYTCLTVAIYFIWRSINVYHEKKDLREVRRIYLYGTAMVLLFFALSAATLSHWFEFKEQSERGSGAGYEFATSWSMPPSELVTYVVPQFFGLSMRNYKDPGEIEVFYWGDMPFTQTNDYLGLLPLILAVIALLKFKGRYMYISLALSLIFLFLAFGKYNPAYPFFYHYLGFKFFRVPKMNLFITAFGIAVMAGGGAQWLLGELGKKDAAFLKKFVYGLAVTAGLLLLITLIAQFNQDAFVKYFFDDLKGSGMSFNPSLAEKRYSYAVEGMWIALVLVIAGLVVIASRLNIKLKPEILFVFLALYFVIDIFLLNQKFINGVSIENNPYLSKDTAVEFFEKDKGLYRVLNAVNDRSEKFISYQVPNKYVKYKIQSVTGYEAVQLSRYGDLLNKLNLNSSLLDFMNVKYIVLDKRAVNGTVGDRAGKYEIVVDEDVKILRNRNMLPRAFAVHKASIIRDPASALSFITGAYFNPLEKVVLEQPVADALSKNPKPARESSVNIVSYENDEIVLEAAMADKGFVFLGDKYYPGWNAYIDGKPAKILRANYAFRTIYLDEGNHRVKFLYEPATYKRGLWITLLAILLVAAFFIIKRYKVQQNKVS